MRNVFDNPWYGSGEDGVRRSWPCRYDYSSVAGDIMGHGFAGRLERWERVFGRADATLMVTAWQV